MKALSAILGIVAALACLEAEAGARVSTSARGAGQRGRYAGGASGGAPVAPVATQRGGGYQAPLGSGGQANIVKYFSRESKEMNENMSYPISDVLLAEAVSMYKTSGSAAFGEKFCFGCGFTLSGVNRSNNQTHTQSGGTGDTCVELKAGFDYEIVVENGASKCGTASPYYSYASQSSMVSNFLFIRSASTNAIIDSMKVLFAIYDTDLDNPVSGAPEKGDYAAIYTEFKDMVASAKNTCTGIEELEEYDHVKNALIASLVGSGVGTLASGAATVVGVVNVNNTDKVMAAQSKYDREKQARKDKNNRIDYLVAEIKNVSEGGTDFNRVGEIDKRLEDGQLTDGQKALLRSEQEALNLKIADNVSLQEEMAALGTKDTTNIVKSTSMTQLQKSSHSMDWAQIWFNGFGAAGGATTMVSSIVLWATDTDKLIGQIKSCKSQVSNVNGWLEYYKNEEKGTDSRITGQASNITEAVEACNRMDTDKIAGAKAAGIANTFLGAVSTGGSIAGLVFSAQAQKLDRDSGGEIDVEALDKSKIAQQKDKRVASTIASGIATAASGVSTITSGVSLAGVVELFKDIQECSKAVVHLHEIVDAASLLTPGTACGTGGVAYLYSGKCMCPAGAGEYSSWTEEANGKKVEKKDCKGSCTGAYMEAGGVCRPRMACDSPSVRQPDGNCKCPGPASSYKPPVAAVAASCEGGELNDAKTDCKETGVGTFSPAVAAVPGYCVGDCGTGYVNDTTTGRCNAIGECGTHATPNSTTGVCECAGGGTFDSYSKLCVGSCTQEGGADKAGYETKNGLCLKKEAAS